MRTRELIQLGVCIKALRQSRNLSQEDLAAMTGLHRTYIGGIERGERNIGFLNLVRLARALDLTLSELLKDVDIDLTL